MGSDGVRDPHGHIQNDESMMLNQFIWDLQLELANFVSLHYLNSIAQAVPLAETTELAVRSSRRPMGRTNIGGK